MMRSRLGSFDDNALSFIRKVDDIESKETTKPKVCEYGPLDGILQRFEGYGVIDRCQYIYLVKRHRKVVK